MIKLFISHASEDKSSIARPLAQALEKEFKVWFDEYELVIGDSLREKIDEGLRACDYGVVILSQAFFGKKWTRDELDGLFALERKNRKVILPIWHQITKRKLKRIRQSLLGGWRCVPTEESRR